MQDNTRYFVTPDNCRDYIKATKSLAVRHRREELIRRKLAADEEIKELEGLTDKLDEAFELAEYAYQSCVLFEDQTGLRYALPYCCTRVQIAYLVASRSFASFEGIILALLAPASVKLHKLGGIKRLSGDGLAAHFGKPCAALFDRFPATPTEDEDIDRIIYEYCAENLFSSIKSEIMGHHPTANLSMVDKAYNLARSAHSHVTRRSGEAYILHPLYVALILAQNGLDCDIISAALIHDVVEDARPHVSIDQIENAFNATIAAYVDAVTAVDSERFPHDSVAYHSFEKSHNDRDEATYQKLRAAVEASEEMVGALYVKAADMIHNLLTLDAITENELYASIDRTEDSYLELFRKYHLNKFVQIIESECLRYHNPEKYRKLEHDYSRLLNNSRAELDGYSVSDKGGRKIKHFDGFHEVIRDYIASFNKRAYFDPEFEVNYEAVPFYPSEIAERLREYSPDTALSADEIVISKLNILIEKFYVILSSSEGDRNLKAFIRAFITNYQSGLAKNGYIITGLHYDKTFRQYHFYIVDPYFNNVDVIITMQANYIESLYGSFYIDRVTPAPRSGARDLADKITVRTPGGKTLRLARGSTVLDFAYYVHAELCLEAYDGIVNNKHRELSAKLNDGDTVYICKNPNERIGAHKKEVKNFTPRVTVHYLRYTKNVEVQRYISNYIFQKIYGDNTSFEDVVGNDAFLQHLDNMFNINSAIMHVQEEDYV